jgi:hypothetical protein
VRPLSALFLMVFLGTATTVQSQQIEFARDIRPILSDKCIFCHGPDEEHREAGLRLDLEDEARTAIVAGDIEASELIARITSDDPDSVMPPAESNKTLSAKEIDLFSRWVTDGAVWTQHWSFIPAAKPELPQTDQANRSPIDAMVSAQLAAHGMRLSPQASREKLIRRVTFDLTGLPPTIEEIDAFLADSSSDAFERVVDRLLDSPRYGQRMALAWLDAARYGDTSVYHADGPREMWAWRDAVVDAYNSNLPFDQFSIAQLAGDLIPDATLQQKVLAGFNRNNGTTDEGGAIAEEYRVEYCVDRVKTTSTVWLGLTMECAQCHDHKYDPISTQDYYRFYAFFNASSDTGMQTRKGNSSPTVPIPNPENQARLPIADQQLTDIKKRIEAIESECEPAFAEWLEQQETISEGGNPGLDERVVHVPLMEGTGNSVADSVRPDRKYEIHGTAQWVKSRYDWGLTFDGSNYVDLGNVGDFERTDSFSYGGWVKPVKAGGQGALLARMDDANGYRGYDLLVSDGPISVHLINTWPTNAIKVTTKKNLKANQWQHVMATYDGSSKAKGIKIYVDGELWDWKIEQNGLKETIKTEKSLLIASRHPGSRLKASVDEVQVFGRVLEPAEVESLSKAVPIDALLAIEAESRSDDQHQAIKRYYLSTQNDEYIAGDKKLVSLTQQVERLRKPLTTVMIMGDMTKPRDTFILNRGAYDSPTDQKVEAGTPAVLPPLDSDAPRNRLGLAQWLFRDDHPLTARVAANRYWQMFFGVGLITTPENLGAQGEFPSHPDLLDWLAVDFRNSGWDVKRFVKQLVMSETYRQSSSASGEAFQADPDNRLYGRGSRFRLQGEFIRDNALFIGGLMVETAGGPGVKPYQPAGLWAEVGLGGNPKFVQDHGEKLYRRSLYTYWKRSAPPPAMQIFDAPTREKCTIRRARTNTPLQALVTLNDTQFVEAARHFARRVICEAGRSTDDRIEYAFRLATARRPNQPEREALNEVLATALEHYQSDSDAADKLLAVGESARDEVLDPSHHAAWTILVSAIMNLDESLTRE